MTDIVQQLKELGVKPISDLGDSKEEKLYTVIQYAKPTSKTRFDYCKVMNLTDPSVGWDNRPIGINMFYPDFEAIPPIANEGDIFIVTNVLVNRRVTKKQLLLDKAISQWAVIHRTTLNVRESSHERTQYKLTENDIKVVQILSNWYREIRGIPMDVDDQDQQQQPDMKNGVKVEDEVNPPIIRGTGNRYILPTYKISDKYQFFDYIGMVVSYQLQTNDRAVMLLTDYTENPRPMDGYAAEGTVDPKLIIQGTLWDEHAEGSEKLSLKFGDVVYVRNLAAKSSKSNALELTLRGEKNTRAGYGKCKIKKFDDLYHPYIRAMNLRRERYEKRQKPTSDRTQVVDPSNTISIVTEKINVNTSSIHSVVNDKEPVQKYKIRTKIIDYRPHSVTDWVRKWCCKCDSTFLPTQEKCESCHSTLEYTLKGAFRCEDKENNILTLIIHGEDSLKLFKDLPPSAPTEVYQKSLLNRFTRICPGDHNNDVYFDLGVKSYVVPGRGRRYRITDTQFRFM